MIEMQLKLKYENRDLLNMVAKHSPIQQNRSKTGPLDHLLRKMEAAFNFSFISNSLKDPYSHGKSQECFNDVTRKVHFNVKSRCSVKNAKRFWNTFIPKPLLSKV